MTTDHDLFSTDTAGLNPVSPPRVIRLADGDRFPLTIGPDDSWVDVPDAIDEDGRLRQVRGVTPSPGLYTLGRISQHTRGSALLGWVGADAALLAELITARASTSGRRP